MATMDASSHPYLAEYMLTKRAEPSLDEAAAPPWHAHSGWPPILSHACRPCRLVQALREQSLPKRKRHSVWKGECGKISPGIVQMKLHPPRRNPEKVRNILHR